MSALVLALNPSVDAEWRVGRVRWEEKNLIDSETRWAGGKGINVARWLRHLGGEPRLLLPLGGAAGEELARGLQVERLRAIILPVRGGSRVNVIVTTARDGQLRFNQRGPELSRGEWLTIRQETARALSGRSCLVLSGSLPPGLPRDAYSSLIRLARRAGVKTVLDCDGEALRVAVSARPFLVKPNEHELAEWAGRDLKTEAALVRAARALSRESRGWVLVSRGRRGGLLANDEGEIILPARPPRLAPVTTVGAGDALLAAVVQRIESKAPPAEWLRWGMAAGAAATQTRAGRLPSRRLVGQLVREVEIEGEAH